VRTECKATFVVANFHNSSAKIFLSLHDILTSVTCPIVVLKYQSTWPVYVWWLWAFHMKK